MKNLDSFKSFALKGNSLTNVFGGAASHLDNCLASIHGACSTSCGGDDNSCFGGCEMNQTNQCYAILGDN